jgi:hypothetical protein
LFENWLSTLPIETSSVRVEAGFASDSTILVISIPIEFLGYLPESRATTLLGVIRSRNLLGFEPAAAEQLNEAFTPLDGKEDEEFGHISPRTPISKSPRVPLQYEFLDLSPIDAPINPHYDEPQAQSNQSPNPHIS